MNSEYTTIYIGSKDYPKNLSQISGPPPAIHISGKYLKKDNRAIAIVGSRLSTEYGKKMAWNFSSYLAKQGFTIISGLARGIDSVAHLAALKSGGRTIAVLGHGLDMIYPSENASLAREIVENGALITEFSLGTPPLKSNFLARNRIISGLSIGVLVVEGARRSGTLSIANWAASQNREVFAIPGRLDSETSYLPNYLIEQGANIVTKPQDILDMVL